MNNKKITLVNDEIKMKDNDFIVSKTDAKGIITYCNEIFIKMSFYKEDELIGQNHNIIRHPEMPKAAFRLAWDFIKEGKEFFGFVKNRTKTGAYYWVFANITADYDLNGNIIGFTSVRRKPSSRAVDAISPIYKQMCQIEKTQGISASTKFLVNFLEENNTSYDELIIKLQGE